jgi:four helix bundle protein
MGRGVQRFTNLRAWQACDVYKKAIYRLCDEEPLSRDWKLRGQLQESVAGPPAHLAEGFGRFSPPDFARYTVMARSSLIESQNHLLDAVDRRHITEERRRELDSLAEIALQEVTGLMEYLQSPEALRNARLARERRIALRQQRRRDPKPPPQKPANGHTEPRTPNNQPRTQNNQPGTPNDEPGTPNDELEPNLNTNRAPRTKKTER